MSTRVALAPLLAISTRMQKEHLINKSVNKSTVFLNSPLPEIKTGYSTIEGFYTQPTAPHTCSLPLLFISKVSLGYEVSVITVFVSMAVCPLLLVSRAAQSKSNLRKGQKYGKLL